MGYVLKGKYGLQHLVGRGHRLGQLVRRFGGIGQAGGQVAAISRVTEHIDLFVAGTDGLVYSTWWDGATGWYYSPGSLPS